MATCLLQAQAKEWRPEDTPLVPLTSKHFVISKVKNDSTLEDVRKEKKLESSNILDILLEYKSLDKSDIGPNGIRDVILMDKVSGVN